MVEAARRRDPSRTIDYRVQDAARLAYADATFDHAIYLGCVLCFVEDDAARARAFAEARRVLRAGGTAVFSFLCLDGRERSPLFRAYARYLALVRRARAAGRSPHDLPWLRRRGWPNPRALLDGGPHVHWFGLAEAAETLRRARFRIVGAGSETQVARGELPEDPRRVAPEELVYFVCRAA
jgi:SAM-dependent methyltransferase